jgi:hypothetical protein
VARVYLVCRYRSRINRRSVDYGAYRLLGCPEGMGVVSWEGPAGCSPSWASMDHWTGIDVGHRDVFCGVHLGVAVEMEDKRMAQRKKSAAEIQRGNLRKTLSRLKETVAEKEELWLEIFLECALPLSRRDEEPLNESDVIKASILSDKILAEYENRWGVCGSSEGKT